MCPRLSPQLSRLDQFAVTHKHTPTLLQRRRSRNEERLRPFTDYSTKPSRRPTFHRAVTISGADYRHDVNGRYR